MTRDSGFSLIELIVTLALTGILAAATGGLVRHGLRVQRGQLHVIEAEQAVRMAVSFLPLELADVSADRADSDLKAISRSSVTYRSAVNVYFICAGAGPTASAVIVNLSPWFGTDALDTETQEFLVLAGVDTLDWARLDVRTASLSECDGGQPGIRIVLGTPLGMTIPVGAPVRGYRQSELRLYRDGGGTWWLGQRTADRTGRWNTIQPLLGPLAAGGFELDWLDRSGATGAPLAEVHRVSIRVDGASVFRVPGEAPVVGKAEIWLRNNAR